MPQVPHHTGGGNVEFNRDSAGSEINHELGMNILKATAIQNFSDFTVPMWSLLDDDSLSSHKPPSGIENSFSLKTDGTKGHGGIKTAVIGTDERKKVDPSHFAPGGKYRSVAKLSLVFRKNGFDVKMMGTGWLIRPDLLVTAGHCVYDKSYGMGQVKSIVAYLGYQGAESIQNSGGRHISNIEVARGKVVGTTAGWIQDLGRQYDIAWVKLSESFKEVGKNGEPINWTNTPFQGSNSMLGVVGYPGDKELDGEYGAEMYECWGPTTFDLARSKMIQYTIDSYGGQSGSPIFYSANATDIDPLTSAPYPFVTDLMASSIGVHTYGGTVNSGTPIGPYGVPMSRHISVMDRNVKLTREIRYVPENAPEGMVELPIINGFDPVISMEEGAFRVKMPFADEEFGFGHMMTMGTKVLGGFFESEFEDEDTSDDAAVEGFFDFLGKAAKAVGGVSLPMVLGPQGVPAALIATATMNILGRSLQKRRSDAEDDDLSDDAGFKKHLYQAALADATFDACCKHYKILDEEGFFDTIKKWIPVGIKAAVAAGSAIGKFAETTGAGNDNSMYYSSDDQWQWDTLPINPDSTPLHAFEGLKNAFDLGNHYQDFVNSMTSKEDCFPYIKWASIQKHEFKKNKDVIASGFQSGPGSSLTESMHTAIAMRALAGTMLLSAIENADPDQLKAIDETGFFIDTTAALRKLLGKYGDRLMTNGPQILDSVYTIAKDHQGNI